MILWQVTTSKSKKKKAFLNDLVAHLKKFFCYSIFFCSLFYLYIKHFSWQTGYVTYSIYYIELYSTVFYVFLFD